MSSFLSSLIVVALTFVALLPVAVAYRWPRAGSVVAGFYLLFFFGLILARSDFTRSVPEIKVAPAAVGTPPPEVCQEAIGLADQGGIILDRRTPGRVVVNGAVWRELPEQAREAIAACLGAAPGGGAEGTVEIVEQ